MAVPGSWLGSDRIGLAAALKKSDRILPADPCSQAPPTQGNPRDTCNSETPSPVSPKELTQPGEELGRPTIRCRSERPLDSRVGVLRGAWCCAGCPTGQSSPRIGALLHLPYFRHRWRWEVPVRRPWPGPGSAFCWLCTWTSHLASLSLHFPF